MATGGNYIKEINQLIFPNGKVFEDYLDGKITEQEKDNALYELIVNAENWLDSQLRGQTVTPALHIEAECKQIALEYTRYLVLRDNYLFYGAEEVKLKSDLYLNGAKSLLKILSYNASASIPVANDQNSGDGTISAVTVDSEYTITEDWTIVFDSEYTYDVFGSVSGYSYSGDIRLNGGKYPILGDGEVSSIYFTITEGEEYYFAAYDTFTFTTYGPSYIKTAIKTFDVELSY